MNHNHIRPEIAYMEGPEALPRVNGDLVFEVPWQGRALALAIAMTDQPGIGWDHLRSLLIAAIETSPERPYWENWVTALEALASSEAVALATG